MAVASPVAANISFRLNGETVHAPSAPSHTTLLDYLRARGLTGAKEGCAEGECGACTVVMVRPGEAGSVYKPVNSCLVFLAQAAGHEVLTVEALAHDGELHPVQRAMASGGGSQCGYCTPGFVMSLFAEHYRPGRNGACETAAMAGNLCRCTGYRPIRDAALSLGPASADDFRARLARPAPTLDEFACNGFARPASLSECLGLLAADPGARIVAGATDLAVDTNLKGVRFRRLISVEAVPELRGFDDAAAHVDIGAALSLDEIASRWTAAPTFFHEWLELFASPPIRNRATLGGNLATASPIGDAAPMLLALDAEIRIAGTASIRGVPLHAFFTGYRKTALQPGEVIHSIRIPKPLPERVRFYKVAKRRLDDISSVAACFALDFERASRVAKARFAYGGVAATPIRATTAEDAVAGFPWDAAAAERAQAAVARALSPIGDHRASAAYRLAMAQSLIGKFHEETPR
ncbi:MAG: FAD binding domain-containing protein [Acidobacteria bacterium]|nr:FAD binding domain-containing protein [Acidobacteriota bacterium]